MSGFCMVFLNPGFLYGLLAVGIPIIIHLINFSRPKKIPFTRLEFLRTVSESVKQKLRLRDYLVLAARISFIVFLVLALAHPFRPAKDGGVVGGLHRPGVWLDNSQSTQAVTGEGTLLNASMDVLRKVVEAYPAQTEFYLLDNDFLSSASLPVTGSVLEDRLAQITYSVAARTPEAAAKRLNATGDKVKSEYWLVSDFQKSTAGNLAEFTAGKDSAGQTVNLVVLPPSEGGNVYVDSVWTSEPFIKKGFKNRLNFRLRNTGEAAVNDLNVRFFVEDRQYAAFNATVAARADELLTTEFVPENDNELKCRLEFDEPGPDFDNVFYFVLRPSPPIKVTVLAHKPSASFAAKALSKEPLFSLSVADFKAVDYEQMKNADAVLLENYNFDDAPLSGTLLALVREGKTLIIFPGAAPVAGDPLLARVGRVLPGGESGKTELKVPDHTAPFFEGVFEAGNNYNVQMPEAKPLLDLRASDVTLLRLKSELPFYAIIREGNGSIYAAASPADAAYTGFHKHSVFLPVLYKSVTSAASGSDAPAFRFNGASFEVRLPAVYTGNVLFRLEGAGAGIVPEQRTVKDRLIMSLPANELKPGFYTLTADSKTIKTLAFNVSAEESETNRYTQQELTEIFSGYPSIKIFAFDGAENLKKQITVAKTGISLRMQCIWAALIFLLIESLIIRFYRQ